MFVAIQGAANFAAADIDASSLRFGPAAAAVPVNRLPGDLLDTGTDGIEDLRIPFRIDETGLSCDFADDVTIIGATLAGQLFEGSDFVTTQDCVNDGCHP